MRNGAKILAAVGVLVCVCANTCAVCQQYTRAEKEELFRANYGVNSLFDRWIALLGRLEIDGTVVYSSAKVLDAFYEIVEMGDVIPVGTDGEKSLRSSLKSRIESTIRKNWLPVLDRMYVGVSCVQEAMRGLGGVNRWLDKFRGNDEIFKAAGDFVVGDGWQLRSKNGKPVLFELRADGVVRTNFVPNRRTKEYYEGLDIDNLLSRRNPEFSQWLSGIGGKYPDGRYAFYELSKVLLAMHNLIHHCIPHGLSSDLRNSVEGEVGAVLESAKSSSVRFVSGWYIGTDKIEQCLNILEKAYEGVQRIREEGVQNIIPALKLGKSGSLIVPADKKIVVVHPNQLSVKPSEYNLIKKLDEFQARIQQLQLIK